MSEPVQHDPTVHPVDCPACQAGGTTWEHYKATELLPRYPKGEEP